MNFFDKKYGFVEDEKVREFHRSRRMFCVYEDRLYIADANLPYSHAVWFENMGWLTQENDELMESIVRGIVDKQGDSYFYVGYDLHVDAKSEKIFFPFIKELSATLKLPPSAKVYGGFHKGEPGTVWQSIKSYGSIAELT